MKNSKENILARQTKILEYLQKNNFASVKEICGVVLASPATVRRDLVSLKNSGDIHQYHGGAALSDPSQKLPEFDSERYLLTNIAEKEAIAYEAAQLIESGDTVFINSSSTAIRVIPYIKNKYVTIVTNNGRCLTSKRNQGTDLVFIGGEVPSVGNSTYSKMCTTGEFALNTIKMITANKCILGVSGITFERGLSSMAINEPAVNREMLKNCSGEVIVVADNRKIGINHSFNFGRIESVNYLITDSNANREELDKILATGCEVIIAKTKKD